MPTAAQYPPFDPLAYARQLKADIAKNERAILELKAEIAKAQADIAKIQQTILEVRADIVKTQQAIHELKAHVDVRHAQTQGQFRLHNWMLTALLGLAIAIALKLFL